MKTRLSFFAPAAVPDITALEQRYALLITQVMALIAANDFTQTLSVSRDIARAARALMAGKAQMAAAELKRKMLLNTAWRSRVIADLGGYRKLHLWQRARRRAAMRAALLSLSSPVENGGTRRQTALPPAELTRRAGIRDRARACAHPLIFKDPVKVDQEGQFRLPAIPRAPLPYALRSGARPHHSYEFDARPVKKQNKYAAAEPITPLEFYQAREAEIAAAQSRLRFALGPTPGRRRHPKFRRPADAARLPVRRSPYVRRQNRAPPARAREI